MVPMPQELNFGGIRTVSYTHLDIYVSVSKQNNKYHLMKNYIRDVIDRYINHDYPKEVDQDLDVYKRQVYSIEGYDRLYFVFL